MIVAALAVATIVGSCEHPVTDLGSIIAQLVVSPQTVTLQQNQAEDFLAVGFTATSEGKSGTAALTVTTVPVASVTVSPATASVPAGQTMQLAATPKDANGNSLSGRTISWSSGSTAVATVSASGLVTGVAAGAATITATAEG